MKKVTAKEITPKEARCGVGPCPSLFQTNRKTVMVIGSVPAGREIPRNVLRKIGKNEAVVEIPITLIKLD